MYVHAKEASSELAIINHVCDINAHVGECGSGSENVVSARNSLGSGGRVGTVEHSVGDGNSGISEIRKHLVAIDGALSFGSFSLSFGVE
jgi:hypothetical protein